MSHETLPPQAVAIIGMAGRFPGAADIPTFWRNLCEGVESVRDLDEDALRAAGVDPAQASAPGYVRRASVLDGIEDFDDAYFQLNPRDAQLKDPQHRALLECAEAALQDAGYVADACDGLIALYAGVGYSGYLQYHLMLNQSVMRHADMHQLYLHNEKDFAPTFVSYTLGLKGPSVNVNCGCSSSLVAVHMACRSLAQYETDIAIAGAASIIANQTTGYAYNEGGILSPDGRCRPFDAEACGTLPASGVGLVVLKRYEDAVADGDHIHAVIRGSAINNDGRDKIGFTAPGGDGQTRVIEDALAFSETDPASVGYVEAHGTGTRLGDPIEIASLKRGYGAGAGPGRCSVGSLKANIGHLNAASGVAGLIKTALVVRDGLMPPLVHFQRPNPHLELEGSAFTLHADLRTWPAQPGPRRAAVSSFGIGGTNAHALVEEPPRFDTAPSRRCQILPLSALDDRALAESATRLAQRLQDAPSLPLADVAHTLQVGRRQLQRRSAVIATNADDAVRQLRDAPAAESAINAPRIAFLFPGQGSQHPGMAQALHQHEPAFREALDACLAPLSSMLGTDLRAMMFATGDAAAEAALRETRHAQPAIFAVSYALARMWQDWGVAPVGMLGHSIGEYVAACIAGVFTLEDALRLVVERGRAMQAAPEGAMLAVELDEAALLPLLPEGAVIAAYNAETSQVVAGTEAAIAALELRLGGETAHRRLQTSHAFHSPLMDGVLDGFRRCLEGVALRAPDRRFVSNLTGDWVDPQRCATPDYWVEHLRLPVRFHQALRTLAAEADVILEVGPGRSLSTLAQRSAACAGRRIIASLPHPRREEPADAAVLTALGRLWCAGAPIDWRAYRGDEVRRRVSLPAYPFQRRRHWVERIDVRAVLDAIAAIPAAASAGRAAPAPSTAVVDPTTPVATQSSEASVIALCEDRLGLAGVRSTDNFFDLGGDSLIATQLVARLRAQTGSRITLERVMSAANLAEIARRAEAAAPDAAAASASGPVIVVPALDAERKRDGVRLSAAQQRMWFFDRFEGGHAANNIVTSVRLRGALDTAALSAAFDAIVRRHESLRTVFFERDGHPLQRVLEPMPCPFDRIDLSDRGSEGAMAAAETAVAAFGAERIDLERGPLLRALLVRLGTDEDADDHVLTLVVHHIVGDSWSMGVIISELQQEYAAHAEGREAAIAPLPVQYPDFAEWQQSPEWQAVIRRQLDHWVRTLEGADPHLCIGGTGPRPEQRSFDGRSLVARLDPEVAQAVADGARRARVTPFVLLLSAYALLLAHETGSDDLVVGTDVANRRLPELERVIGFFVNLLALRVRLDDAETVADFVHRTHAATLTAHEHQDIPFDQVVAALNHPRDARFAPLFQHKLVFQNAPVQALRLGGVDVLPWAERRTAAELDMVVTAWSNEDQFGLRIEYSTALFSERMCEAWMDRLQYLIGRVAGEGSVTVGELRRDLRAREEEQRRRQDRALARQLTGIRRRSVGLAEAANTNGSES